MKARKSVSVRRADSADGALSSGDDFRASAPGKPFLKALLATFNTLEQEQQQQRQRQVRDDVSSSLSDDNLRRRVRRLSSTKRTAAFITTDSLIAEAGANAGEFVLRINAQCLFYLQQLFRAMLVPVTSDQGLVKQWRINVMFLNGLEVVEEVDLGPASPRNILKLGGHMLEQTALIINGTSDEANLGAPGAFDLASFPRLQHLRLDQCNLADVKGLSVLRSRLKELRFYSLLINRLSALLESTELEHSSTDAKREAGSTWTQLESLAVVNCSLTELDSSFELLPVVKTIRLSQNQLSSIGQLEACTCLQELDLSFNHISSMVGANRILPQIISLDLSHNMLSSTAGLEKLFTVEVLNLSHNAISSISEVGYLVSLPNLHSLFLRGNPIESSPTYRSDVQKLLTNEVTLDGIPWASQDVDDFAKQGELKDEFSASLLILKHQGRVGGKLESRIEATSDRSYLPTNNRVAVVIRSLLLAMAAIVIVQGIVHLTWSLDIESERLLLKLLGSLAAVGAMVFTTLSILSWAVNRLIRRATVDVPAGVKAHQQNEGSFRRLSRRVSSCLVDETFVRRQAPAANGTRRSNLGTGKISITVLQSSLQNLSESPEELSLLVFLNVCSELQTMVELLSPTASDRDGGGLIFAWNILARCISTLEASAGDLRRATLQELLRDDTEGGLEPNTSGESVEAALQDTVHLFKFMAKFLLELTSGTADKKQENGRNALAVSLLSAYRHAFAQLHPWIVQKTIADAIPVSSPSQSAFYAALRRGNERVARNDLILKDVLRTCADELQACASVCEALVQDAMGMPNQ